MRWRQRPKYSLHELLVMAVLAALGGMTSSAISVVGRAVLGATAVPGGLQFLAGLHVLWLVLALGIIGKPGTATLTSLLKAAVELLSGNPHGLLVFLYSGLAGVAADAVWIALRGRQHPVTYVLAGGSAAASNLVVFRLISAMPNQPAVIAGLAALAGIAFVSGAVLGGLLGWSLLAALQRAGVTGASTTPG